MTASKFRFYPFVVILVLFGVSASVRHTQSRAETVPQRPAPAFTVDGSVALASLISLSDNHLQKLTHRAISLRPGDILVVGVGSVGRPEDGPGATYVIYDDALRQVEMMRV